MLFCAGRGSRMRALTEKCPKPMIHVAGRPLVDYALAHFDVFDTRVANTHYLPESLEQHLAIRGVTTIFEPDLLETGGGLKNASSLFNGDAVFTMNTDAVWLGDGAVDALRSAWNPDIMDALLLTVHLSKTHGHLGSGDFDIDADGRIHRGGDLVYTGLQIIKLDAVKEIADTAFSMNKVWDALDKKGRIFGAQFDGQWCDVGHPKGIEIAESALKDHGNV
ncbi:nucleotidyltransferase family protein [Celeribacter marinus]|uniref:Nucleotidyltransferase n=2 Tax=Celeribacter marinus TaxID=1397108 RepID=A0A0P0A560_9RHOB|nr:nucleotidyltransferase [Celeribacter marinus]